MSQSRQGAARSAAILLYSYHLNVLKDHSSPSLYQTPFYPNDLMARYIEQQLEDQKKLLYLDIPTLRNHNSLMRKLHLNPRSEPDLSEMGNSPLHKRIHRRFFNPKIEADERSGVEDLFVNKSTEASDLNGSSQSNTHNVSFITDGGYTNPLAYNTDDLRDTDDDDDDDDEAYQRSLIYDNLEFFIGAMPTPVSEGPASIAVC